MHLFSRAQSIRISSLIVCAATFFVAIGTFTNLGAFAAAKPVALWVIYLCFNAAFLLIYVILQIVLVLNTLDDRWPLGTFCSDLLIFLHCGSSLSQRSRTSLSLYDFPQTFRRHALCHFVFPAGHHFRVCPVSDYLRVGQALHRRHVLWHYLHASGRHDGVQVLGLYHQGRPYVYSLPDLFRSVYSRFTRLAVEFSVGGKTQVWEIKDPLLSDDAMMQVNRDWDRE